MKIYIVVKYKDIPVFGMCGDTEYVTETEVLQAYFNKQDANIESGLLNRQRTSEEDNILYDVIESDVY